MASISELLFVVLSYITISQGQEIVVELPEGKVAGHTLTSFMGNPYYAFQEIPYAAKPIGNLRFAAPQEPEPWSGILNATKNTKQCVQGEHLIPSTLTDSEDCLYLNVYTPQLSGNEKPLPVYVYVHGGAYVAGSGAYEATNPGRFIDYGVIVVTMNYRLAAFGFLTTGDGIIPGNLGFKDQRFAFRWVKSHIALFGGDPNRITIGGESAGSTAVGYHLIAQNSQDLYIGGIMESGSSISQICYTPYPRQIAFGLAKALDPNFTSNDSSELLAFLRNASVEDIVNASLTVDIPLDNAAGFILSRRWLPVIENSTEDDPLITAPMHESFINGKINPVPVLLGFNSEEALGYAASAELGAQIAKAYDDDSSLLIDSKLNIPAENRSFVGAELKKIYTNTSFTEDLAALVKLSTDAGFTIGMLRQAILSSKYAPIYFYQFSYMGPLGEMMIGKRVQVPGLTGVQHAEDVGYLWDFPLPSTITANDFLTMERMLILWTNFIKYQNPTPNSNALLNNVIWPTLQEDDVQFLNINDTLEIQANPRKYKETSELLLKYMQPPYAVI